jgi:hypothetical protein
MRQALGGATLLDSIRTLSFKTTGEVTVPNMPMSPPRMTEEYYFILPDHFLHIRTLGTTLRTHQGFKPDVRTSEGASAGPAPAGRLLMRREHDAARLVLVLMGTSLATHPLAFSYAGIHETDGPAYHIVDAKGWGAWLRLYVDVGTRLPAMVTTLEIEGKGVEIHLMVSDFKRVKGPMDSRALAQGRLMWPHAFEQELHGTVFESFAVTEWKVNPKIDKRRFDTPGSKSD